MEDSTPSVFSRCPSCQLSMQTVGLGAMILDRCSGCQGLWFDTREVEALAEELEDLPAFSRLFETEPDSGRGRPFCPACVPHLLSLQRHGGISYFVCHGCRGCFIPGYQVRVLAAGNRPPEVAEGSPQDRAFDGWLRQIFGKISSPFRGEGSPSS